MPETTGTRPLSWWAEQAPDYLDTDDDAEEREIKNAEWCDFLLDERRERDEPR